MKAPLLSIISVARNNVDGLRRTYESLKAQLRSNPRLTAELEWIVVDGGSSDGSSQFLSQLSPPFRYLFRSEPDFGIFDAMNKGVRWATGTYLLFINSGDELHDESVLAQLLPLLDPLEHDLIAGEVALFWGDLSNTVSLRPWVCHQATVIRSTIFEEQSYDVSKKYFGDLCFWKSLQRRGAFHVYRSDVVVCRFQLGGVGNAPTHLWGRLHERISVAREFRDRTPCLLRVLHTSVLFLVWKVFGERAYYRLVIGLGLFRLK